MTVGYDITLPGFLFDVAGTITSPAERVQSIAIGGVTYLANGVWRVDPTATTVDIATLAFSATGGDQWFRTQIGGSNTYLSQLYGFTTLGLTDQNALQQYIEFMAGGDPAFDISTFKPEYAIAQSITGGRISIVPEPTSLTTIGLATLLVAIACRRRVQVSIPPANTR
jgi:hypothetical protein